MENTPIIPPTSESGKDQEDKKEAKKKKNSRKLGSFAADLKTERQERAEPKAKAESLWPFSSPNEAAPNDKTPEALPSTPEVSESEAPTEHISEFEEALITQRLAETRQADIREELAAENEPLESVELEAAQAFHEKLRNGQGIESAEADTLAERGIEESVDAEPAAHASEIPQEFGDVPVQITRPEMVESERSEAAPDPVRPHTQSRRTLVPSATEVWAPGSGMYAYRGIADGRSVSMVKPEYISTRDELLIKNIPGGIVGYLIGRRRGRLKAEKKFNTVKKKLEKQVQSLEEVVVAKERRIRQIVREQAQAHPERIVAVKPVEKSADSLKRGGEARQLHEQQPVPERLGHLIVGAERTEQSHQVASEKSTSRAPEKIQIDKNVETLSRAELLSISEKIILDGSTLHQIYETSLVGERGLRRLVQEHLRGGDVKKALRREIVEREMDFERDPAMRDHASHDLSGDGGSLQALLAQQSSAAADSEEEVAFYKARASYEANQSEQQSSRRKLMDVSLVAVILILCAAITILYLRR